jgi:hypothetical protein
MLAATNCCSGCCLRRMSRIRLPFSLHALTLVETNQSPLWILPYSTSFTCASSIFRIFSFVLRLGPGRPRIASLLFSKIKGDRLILCLRSFFWFTTIIIWLDGGGGSGVAGTSGKGRREEIWICLKINTLHFTPSFTPHFLLLSPLAVVLLFPWAN